VLCLDSELAGLRLRESRGSPQLVENVELEIPTQRFLDHRAVGHTGTSRADLHPPQDIFVDRERRSDLRHIRIIASRCSDAIIHPARSPGAPIGSLTTAGPSWRQACNPPCRTSHHARGRESAPMRLPNRAWAGDSDRGKALAPPAAGRAIETSPKRWPAACTPEYAVSRPASGLRAAGPIASCTGSTTTRARSSCSALNTGATSTARGDTQRSSDPLRQGRARSAGRPSMARPRTSSGPRRVTSAARRGVLAQAECLQDAIEVQLGEPT
jgi:hypothetical protein